MSLVTKCLDSPAPLPACKICGAKSSGVHYGVISCEGCKAFFKRESVKPVKYVCFLGDSCSVGPKARGRCRACRFKKCLEEGMVSQNLVLAPRPTPKLHGFMATKQSASPLPPGFINFAAQERRPGILGELIRQNCLSDNSQETDDSDHRAKRILLEKEYLSRPSVIKSIDHVPMEEIGSRTEKPDRERLPRVDTFRFISPAPGRTEARELAGSSSLTESIQTLGSASWHSSCSVPRTLSAPSDPPGFSTLMSLDSLEAAPANLKSYFTALNKRGLFLEMTVTKVSEAYQTAYMDQIESWTEDLKRLRDEKNVPQQPETSYQGLISALRHEFEGDAVRAAYFSSLLPGIKDLDTEQLTRLLVDRSFEFFLVNHAAYFDGPETYWCIGKKRIHYCRYWANQIVWNDWIELLRVIASEVTDLKLTLTEKYLFLVIVLLDPETTSVDHRLKLSFLHAHYLDALLHLLEQRTPPSERGNIFHKLRVLLERFSNIAHIGEKYYLSLDLSVQPLDQALSGANDETQENVFLTHWVKSRDGDARI